MFHNTHYAPFWSPLQLISQHWPRGAHKMKKQPNAGPSWPALNKGRVNQPAALLRASGHIVLQRPPCRWLVTVMIEFKWSEKKIVRRRVSVYFSSECGKKAENIKNYFLIRTKTLLYEQEIYQKKQNCIICFLTFSDLAKIFGFNIFQVSGNR